MNQQSPIPEITSFPKIYRFSRFTRVFTLIMAMLIIAYSIYFILTQINSDSPTFKRVMPFIILFFSIDSISRNLFSLNTLKIFEDRVGFSFIGKRNLFIPWLNLKKIEVYKGKQRMFILWYTENGVDKKYYLSMQFPNMLEIINQISYFAPHAELDEFVSSLTVFRKK